MGQIYINEESYGGGGASAITDLEDVNVSNPTAGQVLTYDDTNDEWINATASGGASISALTSAEYEDLTTAEKNNGTLYLVDGGGETEYLFSHTVLGTTYGYEQLSDNIWHLGVLVSLNNVVYGGFIHDYKTKGTRLMTSTELSHFATELEMSYDANSSETLNTSNPSMPTMFWRNGANNDTLYLDASSTNVGIKCGYAGCKSHLFYTRVSGNKIIRNEIIYSEYIAS